MMFRQNNIEVIEREGEVYFDMYSVGQALGYEKANGAKTHSSPRKDRIDAIIASAEIEPFVHEGRQYLNEDMIYDFLFESKTKTAKEFKNWLKIVLKDIRTNGAYVSEHITTEQEANLYKFGTAVKRRNTFLNTAVEKLDEEFDKCMKYHKNKDMKEKVKIQKHIIKVLEERKAGVLAEGKAALGLMIAEQITAVTKELSTRKSRSYGSQLARANKEIKNLSEKTQVFEPAYEDYITVPYHPFTINLATDAYSDIKKEHKAYQKWKDNFPRCYFADEAGVDFNQKVYIWLYFDHKDDFDVQNLSKTFIDRLCAYYKVSDKYVQIMRCATNDYVGSYKDGAIYYYLSN